MTHFEGRFEDQNCGLEVGSVVECLAYEYTRNSYQVGGLYTLYRSPTTGRLVIDGEDGARKNGALASWRLVEESVERKGFGAWMRKLDNEESVNV